MHKLCDIVCAAHLIVITIGPSHPRPSRDLGGQEYLGLPGRKLKLSSQNLIMETYFFIWSVNILSLTIGKKSSGISRQK